MLGSHMIKSWSSTQAAIALPSGEAEYYALVKGASVGIGAQSMLSELLVKTDLRVITDASAAIGISKRRGLGKVRHIDVRQRWAQNKVVDGKIKISKVQSKENLSDALTKSVSGPEVNWHLGSTGQEMKR